MESSEEYCRHARKSAALASLIDEAEVMLAVCCDDGRKFAIRSCRVNAATVDVGFGNDRFEHRAAAPANVRGSFRW